MVTARRLAPRTTLSPSGRLCIKTRSPPTCISLIVFVCFFFLFVFLFLFCLFLTVLLFVLDTLVMRPLSCNDCSLSPSRNLQLRWVQRRVALLRPHETRLFVGSPRPAALHLQKARISIGSPCASALHLQKARMSMRCPATVHLADLNFISHKRLAFNIGSANLPVSVAKQVLTGPGIP